MQYKAPLRDLRFVSEEVLDMPSHYQRFERGQAADIELVRSIWEEGAKFCENELIPLNKIGDEEGCTFQDGDVTTPTGFKQAYDKFVESGWSSLACPTEYGGQNMPESVALVFMEMMIACNHSWSMYYIYIYIYIT